MTKEEAWRRNNRNSITVFKNEQITILLICLREGAVIENNSIDGLVTIKVISGKIKMEIEEEELNLYKDQLICLQPFIKHSLEAMEETQLLLINNVFVKQPGL